MTPTPDPVPETSTPETGVPDAERAANTTADQAATDLETQTVEEEAAEYSRLATDGDPTLTDETPVPRGRTTVTWERPTDLAARGAANTLGYSKELPGRLRGVISALAANERGQLQQQLADRSEQLDPATIEQTGTPAIGREGVSR